MGGVGLDGGCVYGGEVWLEKNPLLDLHPTIMSISLERNFRLGSSSSPCLELGKACLRDVVMVKVILVPKFEQQCAMRIAKDEVCTKLLGVRDVPLGGTGQNCHLPRWTDSRFAYGAAIRGGLFQEIVSQLSGEA